MKPFNHVALVFGQTGQTVEFYPPMAELVREGAPTAAATYQVFQGSRSNDEDPEFSGTATLDSVSTTVDAASGYSQTSRIKLNLTATTDIAVGRRYLVTNANGQREMVTVASIAADDYVEAEEPLAYDYASGATFLGLRHSFTVDADFIADASNINTFGTPSPFQSVNMADSTVAPPFRVEWRYTTGSVAQRTWTTFDVARQAAKSRLSITDLRGVIPDVIYHEWITQRGQDFLPQLEQAHRDLELDARAAGYDPNQIRDPQAWDRLCLQKWIVTIGKGLLFSSGDIGPWLDLAMQDYTRTFEKFIGTALRVWVDTGTTGAITIDPPRQLWLRGR